MNDGEEICVYVSIIAVFVDWRLRRSERREVGWNRE